MKIIKLFLPALFTVLVITASAQINYPYTRKANQADTIFGHVLQDPYRWLENLKSEEVKDWFRAEQNFTDSTLNNLNGVDSFINQLQDYMSQKTTWQFPEIKVGKRYYYSKGARNQLNVPLYYRDGNDTTGHFLFDTWSIHKDKRYNLSALKVSPDGKYIMVALDLNGEEYPFVKVFDVTANSWLADSIPHCWPNTLNWQADSKGFIYGFNDSEDRFDPKNIDKDIFKYHALHTLTTSDKTVMDTGIRNKVEKKISDSYYASLFNAESKKRIYLQPNQGFEYEYQNTYYANATRFDNKQYQWKRLYSKPDSVYDFKETESGYYFVSAKGKGFKSLRKTGFTNPDFSNAKILLPEDNIWQLENLTNTKSYIIANYSKYGFINKAVIIDKKTDRIINLAAMKDIDRFMIASLGPDNDECMLSLFPVNRPRRSFVLDIKNDALINESSWAVKNQTLLPGSENIISTLIEVPSYDGTLVPMTIMRDKNTVLDGNNICILYGYGAYGIATKDNWYNSYDPSNNLLMQRGVILVHAYVRGGGEKGEQWHEAGMKLNKPNSWKDLIACAEYLINNKYTRPSKLACTGASAGGILIGRTITERPDLFAAAHIQSGTLNPTRSGAYTNGVGNFPEYGNPGIEKEFNGLVEMDATLHVQPGTSYPALYITTGFNDARVAAWIPAKFAATMQAASSSGKPVLLHTNFEGGHFGDANAKSAISMMKTQLLSAFFMLWQCGHKDFQKP